HVPPTLPAVGGGPLRREDPGAAPDTRCARGRLPRRGPRTDRRARRGDRVDGSGPPPGRVPARIRDPRPLAAGTYLRRPWLGRVRRHCALGCDRLRVRRDRYRACAIVAAAAATL